MAEGTGGAIEPFEVTVSAEQVAELERRLSNTRWPDQLPEGGWDYGTNRAFLEDIIDYWAEAYDWDGFQHRVNAFDQYTTRIDGQRLHFYHVRSEAADARPLLLLHGWPSSVVEFLDVIGPLTDPDEATAEPYHVVAPSLPGYGFSGPTTERGYDVERMAEDMLTLMSRLGYDRFVAQGEDWGAWVATVMAARRPERLAAIYPHKLFAAQDAFDDPMGMLTEADRDVYRETQAFREHEAGYHHLQRTKPQTAAYALNDSPAGLAAWILEKWRTWTDCDDRPDDLIDRDRLLDNVAVYWLTETIGSSMRLYYETNEAGWYDLMPRSVDVPTGHARHPAGVAKTPRSWADAVYDVQHWSELDRGGHFPALEVPELFVADLRAFLADLPAE